MKGIKIYILFFINLILDLAVFSRFNNFGFSLSMTIPTLIVISMNADREKITYYGIFIGFLIDIIFSELIGLRALVFYLISYYVFKNRKYKGNNLRYGMIALFVSVLFHRLITVFSQMIIENSIVATSFVHYLKGDIILDLLVNVVLYIFIYFIIGRIVEKEKKKYYLS